MAVSYSVVIKWQQSNAVFAEAIARARLQQVEHMVDEIMEIADCEEGDASVEFDRYGRPYAVIKGKNVQRSRLMIEARQWRAAKAKPQVYGDKVDVTSGGEKLASPIGHVAIDARVQSIMLTAASRMEAAKLLEA